MIYKIFSQKKRNNKLFYPKRKLKSQINILWISMEKEIIKNEELKSLKLYPVGLALGTYIIAENEDGIYLLDQHAAYERINYERYMQKLKRKRSIKNRYAYSNYY